jgi:hypothetical protein
MNLRVRCCAAACAAAVLQAIERGCQFVLLGSAPDPKVQAEFDELANELGHGHERVRLSRQHAGTMRCLLALAARCAGLVAVHLCVC